MVIGIVCSLVAGLSAWSVAYFAQTAARLELRENTQDMLLRIRERLDQELQSALAIPETLSAFIAAQGKLDHKVFNAVAAKLVNANKHIRNVALAPDNIIKNIYPIAGNELAIGLKYLENPVQSAAVKRAITTRRTVVAGPIELVQGGLGLVSRTPVFRNARGPNAVTSYWGIVSLTVNADSLFVAVGLQQNLEGFSIAARGADATGKHGPAFVGTEQVFNTAPLVLDYPLPGGGSWQLGIMPKVGWDTVGRAPWMLSAVAYVLSIVVGYLAYRLILSKQRILALAMHDRLTGLANRRLFDDRLSQAIKSARRYQRLSALVLLDLDDFKPVNDTYGHSCGDEVLIRVAQRLLHQVREGDTVSRMGGDEFALILQDITHEAQALTIIEQAVAALTDPILLDNGEEMSINSSAGVALFPCLYKLESTASLFDRADGALYQSKSEGGVRLGRAETPH